MNRDQAKQFEKRFLDKIDKTDSCWIWKGKKANGYVSLYTKLGNIAAHRLSYLLYKGEIPHGAFVCHNCPGGDNPSCVNPDHLWIRSHRDNIKDFYQKKDLGIKSRRDAGEIVRIRIHPHLYRRYKVLCAKNDLSIPKQTAELIRKFVEIQEENDRFIGK